MTIPKKNLKLLVVDTETGGFDPHHHSILSIGLVISDKHEIVDALEINIKEPHIVADDKSLAVNKIDIEKHIKDAFTPSETIEKINKFIDNHNSIIRDDRGRAVIAGHNIFFDIDFMRRLYRLGNSDYRKYFSYRNLDTSTILRFFYITGKLPVEHASLNSATDYFNIDIKKRHNALSDAIGTAKLLQKLYTL